MKAVQHGYTLVIDEIDKAPINLTCVLISLVETGEMWLLDGRNIVPTNSVVEENDLIIISNENSNVPSWDENFRNSTELWRTKRWKFSIDGDSRDWDIVKASSNSATKRKKKGKKKLIQYQKGTLVS